MISTTPSGWLWIALLPGWRMSGVDTFAGWVSQARASFRAQIDGADAGA